MNFFLLELKISENMFKINNRTEQNKRTGEKFGQQKMIVQYLLKIVQRGNLAEKKNRTCTIIRYARVSFPIQEV